MLIKTFMSEIKILEKNIKDISKRNAEEKTPEVNSFNLGFFYSAVKDRKLYDFLLEENENEKIKQLWSSDEISSIIEMTTKLEHNAMYSKLYESIDFEIIVNESDEEVIMNLNTENYSFLTFFFKRVEKETEFEEVYKKKRIEMSSILISMCTLFESFTSKLLKDTYLNGPISSKIKDKNLTFEDLVNIGQIESAQDYIVTRHLDGLFRESFDVWSKELCETLGANALLKDEKSLFASISEIYQRRNLFVHTDGIVNRHYIKNVPTTEYEEDEKINLEIDYLNNKLIEIKELSWYLYESYLLKLLKDKEEVFYELNTILLAEIKTPCPAIPNLFKKYSNLKLDNEEINKIAKINYFLYFKFNGEFESVREEVEKFNTSFLSKEFVFAKKILLTEKDELLPLVEDYVYNLTEEEFFSQADWPLFRACDNSKEVLIILNNRLSDIFSGGVKIENNTDQG